MPGMSPFKKETKSVLKKAVKNVKKKKIDFIGIDRASKTEKLAAKQEKKKKNQKNPTDFRPDFPNNEQKRGVVYLSHIPPGFYEEQMRKYFNQFGHVLNVKLARSHKTGNSMGYGFIEFRYAEVAKVVAETMNNYVMCKRVLKAEFVERTFPDRFWRQITPETCKTVMNRTREIENLNRHLTPEEEEIFEQKRLVQLNKILADLKAKGVEYNFQPTYGPRPKYMQKRKKWQPRPQNMAPTERYTPLGEDSMVSLPVMEIDESDPEIDFMTPPNVRKLKLRSSADVHVSAGSDKRPVTGTCPHPAFSPALSPAPGPSSARSPSIRLKGTIGKRKPPKAKALKKSKAKTGAVKKPNGKKARILTKDKLKSAIVAMGGVKNVRVKNKVEPFSSPTKAKASPKSKPESPLKSPAGKKNVVEKKSPVKSPNSKSAVKMASEHCNKKTALKKELAKKLTQKAKAAALGKKKADLLKEKLTKKLAVKKSQAAAVEKKQPKKKLKKSATLEEPAIKTAKSRKALLKKKEAKSISPNKSPGKAAKGKKALLKKKLGSKIAAKKQAIAAKGKKKSVKNVSPKKQAKDKKEIAKKVSPKKLAKDKKEIEKTVGAKKKKAGALKDKNNPTKKAASPKTAKAAKKTTKSKQAQASSGRPVAKSVKKKKQLIKVAWKMTKK